MRPLEIMIPILLAAYLLWRRPRPAWVQYLPAFTIFLVLLHWLLEGYRWQMLPIYVLTAILAIQGWIQRRSALGPKLLVSALTLILLGVFTALPVLLPVPALPTPTGPYAVGTRIYELTDSARPELYSGREESRRFQIQVWYPAEPSPSDEHAPWMPHADIFAPAIATYIHMPSFFLDHLALVKMHAFLGSQLASTTERFPVILFSHGWNGFNAQNTSQTIELASHGYVVVGVQHTYGAVITVFDDGSTAPNNPSALPDGAPNAAYEAAARKLVEQWAGDLAYALDYMETQNDDTDSPFFKALDLTRIGVYGHSTGGGAAIQFCGTDSRCTALLGMDPFMRPVSLEVLDHGVSQPAFFMFSQRWADDVESRNNELFHKFLPNARKTLGVISIDGTAHYDFSDLPLLSPLAPRLGLKGPINGRRVTAILNDYLVSFFETTLKGIPTDLFEDTNHQYNEVKFHK